MSLIPKGTISINQENDTITVVETTSVYNGTTNPNGFGSPNRGNANDITDFVITKPDGSVVTIRNNEALTNPTQAAVPVLLPANTLSKVFTPTDLGYSVTTLVFPDGVYTFLYRLCYRITGTPVTSANGKIITLSGASFNSLTAGFGDTVYIKVINQDAVEYNGSIASIDSDTQLTLDEALDLDAFPDGTTVSIYACYLTNIRLKNINNLLKCFQPKVAKMSLAVKKCCNQCKSSEIDNLMEIFLGMFGVDAQFKMGLYSQANANIATLNKICSSQSCSC